MVITTQIIVLYIAVVAVCMDLCYQKVDNLFLFIFLILGFIYQIGMHGFCGMVHFFFGIGVPVLCLYMLFLFRMLGAGDIKVLSVLGGWIGPGCIAKCIVISILSGAVLSVLVIFVCGNLKERLQYFKTYFDLVIHTKDILKKDKIIPYYTPGNRMENIHFTVPILMSVVIYAGGLLG